MLVIWTSSYVLYTLRLNLADVADRKITELSLEQYLIFTNRHTTENFRPYGPRAYILEWRKIIYRTTKLRNFKKKTECKLTNRKNRESSLTVVIWKVYNIMNWNGVNDAGSNTGVSGTGINYRRSGVLSQRINFPSFYPMPFHVSEFSVVWRCVHYYSGFFIIFFKIPFVNRSVILLQPVLFL